MPDQAPFIAIECADPALAGELADHLARWLRESGVRVEQTREPTRGPVGAQVRLAQGGRLQVDPAALALLQVADRLDHLSAPEGILSRLDQGCTVLCAGYVLASLASSWEQTDPDWLIQINARSRIPDLTLYLETDTGSPEATRQAACYAQAVDCLRAAGHKIRTVRGAAVDEVLACCQEHLAPVVL